MKSTKNTLLSKHLPSATAAGIGRVDPLPSVGAPAPPKDYTPGSSSRAMVQPAPALVTAASAASTELASSTTYEADFGSKAPDAQTLAANLAFAAGWSDEYSKAVLWQAYVKEQTRNAWAQTNPQLDELGPVFSYARGRDATVANQYPSTAKLYDVRREPAVKGAAVRASKKRAKAKGAAPDAGAVVETPAVEVSAAPAAAVSATNGVPAKS